MVTGLGCLFVVSLSSRNTRDTDLVEAEELACCSLAVRRGDGSSQAGKAFQRVTIDGPRFWGSGVQLIPEACGNCRENKEARPVVCDKSVSCAL